jgi:MFS family permease
LLPFTIAFFVHLDGDDLAAWWVKFTHFQCKKSAHLTIMQYSVFGSILTIGAMLGAIFSGTIADRVGRKCVSSNPVSILIISKSTKRSKACQGVLFSRTMDLCAFWRAGNGNIRCVLHCWISLYSLF